MYFSQSGGSSVHGACCLERLIEDTLTLDACPFPGIVRHLCLYPLDCGARRLTIPVAATHTHYFRLSALGVDEDRRSGKQS